ncbi:MAG: transposase [Phycisphaerales bacterium]|nr:transposase [Phycisphaerales bacterium]
MDATLVTAWTAICQQVSSAFTAPTVITFLHIATGWVLCRSKPTVTSLISTIGRSLLRHTAKHWTTYERFFYRARWSLPHVSRLLLVRVVAPLVESVGVERVIDLNIDDTTCGRCGKHVAFAAFFKDASVSNTLKKVIHWSHNWVIGCVAMRARFWSKWVIGLPVWFTLYRKPADCTRQTPFQTRQEIAADMIRQTREALPDWTLRVAADGQYATGVVVQAAAGARSNLVSRIRSDAAIYALPSKPRRTQRGRRPKKGKRLPTPKKLARRQKGWRTVEALVYGQWRKRQVLAVVCLWYHVGKDRPIKLLIVRDPSGEQKDDYMFCTDASVSDTDIIERFSGRWPIEEAIHDGKQLGGLEQVQGWCPRTVVRQAPMALIVQTLVKAWYLRHGVRAKSAQPCGTDWMPDKDHPSYLDMLATLRKVLWTNRININSTRRGRVRELLETLQFTLCAAA